MSTLPRTEPRLPAPDAALEGLEKAALRAAPRGEHARRVHRAAACVRDEIDDLRSTRSALTEALIASQDRLLAVEALAQVNVRGADDESTLDDLLDRALQLTGASQVLLLDGDRVWATRGEVSALREHADIVRRGAVGSGGGVHLLSSPSGSALIGTLEPDDGARRHVAFFRPHHRRFTTADVPLVEAITSAIGIHLAIARMHRRQVEQAVIEREHQLASLLAQSVISEEPPRSSTVDVFARTAPASLSGGDFYVFDQRDGRIWFAVGDVAGKGLPAAMLMTRAVASCRVAFLAHGHEAATDVFARIEDELFDHLDDAGLFTTIAVGCVDERTGQVDLVNAGHSPVVLLRGGRADHLPPSVPPIGVVRGQVPPVCTIALGGADRLVVGTDGLVDQADPFGERFDHLRLDEVCSSFHDRPAAALGAAVLDAVSAFAAGAAASDDATLVVLSFGGGAR